MGSPMKSLITASQMSAHSTFTSNQNTATFQQERNTFGNARESSAAFAPITQSCPLGTQKRDGTCYMEATLAATEGCPDGSVLTNNGCEITSFVWGSYKCDEGYELEGSMCIRNSKVASLQVCPRGFNSTNTGNCVAKSSIAPLRKCPFGYQLNMQNKCVKEVVVEALEHCAPGYTNDLTGACVRETHVAPLEKCPAEQTFDGTKCVAEKKFEKLVSCPTGTTKSITGECVQETATPVIKTCGKNAMLDGAQKCVELSRVSPLYTCPPGYTQNGMECTHIIPAKPYCSNSAQLNHVTGECEMAKKYAPLIKCTEDSEMVGDRCVALKKYAPLETCPEGTVLDGASCIAKFTSLAAVVCPTGYALNGKSCTKLIRELPQSVCPAGSANHNSICIVSDIMEPEISCPIGTTLGSDQQCAITTTNRVVHSCPPNYLPDVNDPTLCVQTRIEVAQKVCEDGSEANLLGKCPIVKNVQSVPVCPHGYDFNGRECSKFTHLDPFTSCPIGKTAVNGVCIDETYHPHSDHPLIGTHNIGQDHIWVSTAPRLLRVTL